MADISLKYGFLGLGMGGCSIASACAGIRLSVKNNMNPYTALLINTNEVDLRKLPDRPNARKYILKGYERGAGRDIRTGEEAFLKHRDEIVRLVQSFFVDRDFVFVVCGLGGGTGTGAVIEAVKLLHAHGFAGRFGLILTLPRNQEGYRVLDNAVQRLQLIMKAVRALGSIQLVDNQKLFTDYLAASPQGGIASFLDHSNGFIAQTLHELNVVTAKYNPLSGYHFDGSELLNVLKTPGLLLYSRCVIDENHIDAENRGTYMPQMKQSIENGVLSAGYDFAETVRCAVSLVAGPGGAGRIFTLGMIDAVEEQIGQYAPFAAERPVATYAGEGIRQLQMYSVFAGLSLPVRVTELVEQAERGKERGGEADEALAVLQGYRSQREEQAADLERLLSGEERTEKPETDDPYGFN